MIKNKKGYNYHDTDTAFYVFKEINNSSRDPLKRQCISAILTSALSVPMDLYKRLLPCFVCAEAEAEGK